MNWDVPRRCALLLLGALSSGCCTGGSAQSIAAVELILLDPITGGTSIFFSIFVVGFIQDRKSVV